MERQVILNLKNIKKYFPVQSTIRMQPRAVKAIDDVSLQVYQGETLSLVGESGCGKSTTGRCAIGLLETTSGMITYRDKDITHLKGKEKREMTKEMQMIFQDPYSSLDSRLSVAELIADPLYVNHAFSSKKEVQERVNALMETVGLAPRLRDAYPHELDGGRRQRIGIARALALNPKFIVCDEPVSALDVSIQAQILNILMDLKEQRGLTYIFITHDLSVVKHISDEIAVMYLGQCVEKASSEDLFQNPLHPYTKALLSAIPVPKLSKRHAKPTVIRGEVGNPIEPKPGCRFAPRCDYACHKCTGADIPLREVSPGHFVACEMVSLNRDCEEN